VSVAERLTIGTKLIHGGKCEISRGFLEICHITQKIGELILKISWKFTGFIQISCECKVIKYLVSY